MRSSKTKKQKKQKKQLNKNFKKATDHLHKQTNHKKVTQRQLIFKKEKKEKKEQGEKTKQSYLNILSRKQREKKCPKKGCTSKFAYYIQKKNRMTSINCSRHLYSPDNSTQYKRIIMKGGKCY